MFFPKMEMKVAKMGNWKATMPTIYPIFQVLRYLPDVGMTIVC